MKRSLVAAVIAAAGLTAPAASAQDAAATVDAAARALGATTLRTVQFSGWGSDYIFGQAYDGNAPWPRFNLPGFTISIDFAAPALRDDRRRLQAENPALGGGFQPVVGELRQVWLLSGGYAWDVAGQTAVPAAVERDMRPAAEGRLAQIWLTPHGFIKAAQTGTTTVRTETVRGTRKQILRVRTSSGVTLEGTLNDRMLVERIETWVSNPVLGDTLFEAMFSGYRESGGVQFPTHILQREGGYPVLDVTVTEVKPNVPLAADVPAAIRQATPAAAPEAERLSDGVWMVPGGAKSVIVEFREHLVVIDAPETEARSLAVIAAIRKVSSKPIKYVINTHTHFDHAGGLRTYAAEGAIIVTHRDNVPYFQQVWANPRTINPDRLATSGKTAVFEGVTGARTFTDGARTLTVYHYAGNKHNAGMLMVFLPREHMLIEADSFTPPAGVGDLPAGFENLIHFTEAVDRLRLDVEQVVPIHGRLTTMDEARGAIDTYRATQLWPK